MVRKRQVNVTVNEFEKTKALISKLENVNETIIEKQLAIATVTQRSRATINRIWYARDFDDYRAKLKQHNRGSVANRKNAKTGVKSIQVIENHGLAESVQVWSNEQLKAATQQIKPTLWQRLFGKR